MDASILKERNLKKNKSELDFYMDAAIAAMQGIQESGWKVGLISDFLPHELAAKSFDIADAMLEELHKRLNENEHNQK